MDVTSEVQGWPSPLLGFTATRKSIYRERIVASLVESLPSWENYAGFVTGACVGGDHIIGEALYFLRPAARHIVVVPANRSQVITWWQGRPGVEVVEMPYGTTYRDRNMALVAHSSGFVGYPEFAEDDEKSKRSGTWQTIRMARHADTLLDVNVLAGAR